MIRALLPPKPLKAGGNVWNPPRKNRTIASRFPGSVAENRASTSNGPKDTRAIAFDMRGDRGNGRPALADAWSVPKYPGVPPVSGNPPSHGPADPDLPPAAVSGRKPESAPVGPEWREHRFKPLKESRYPVGKWRNQVDFSEKWMFKQVPAYDITVTNRHPVGAIIRSYS